MNSDSLNGALYILATSLELLMRHCKDTERLDVIYKNYLMDKLNGIKDKSQNYEY